MSLACPERKAELVAAHLREHAERAGGTAYVKSRFIADELELSAKEIGAAICRLERRDSGLGIERWAYSGGTTWKVRLARETCE